jgi:acyl carrier protein phosphodiesterase
MNFLAHSMFTGDDPAVLVGQFCADFVRGGQLDQFPAAIQTGIRLHRFIDKYTDQHPVNAEARRLFEPPLRRFAGILTDVVYDHYLATRWERYTKRPLRSHVDHVYRTLDDNFELLPLKLQRFARLVIDDDILMVYLQFSAVEQTLERISWRSGKFEALGQAGDTLQVLEQPLNDCFERFYPDLIQAMHDQGYPLAPC